MSIALLPNRILPFDHPAPLVSAEFPSTTNELSSEAPLPVALLPRGIPSSPLGAGLRPSDDIPLCIHPVVEVGAYEVGNSVIMPGNVVPGMELMIQNTEGAFIMVAPPDAVPGMQLENVRQMRSIPSAVPVMLHDEMVSTDLVHKTHDKCGISLAMDRPGPYRTGETISGSVMIIGKQQQLKVKSVSLKLECRCTFSRSRKEGWHASEDYEPYSTDLLLGPAVLGTGIHEFPFNMELPITLPHTMKDASSSGLVYAVAWRLVVSVDRGPLTFNVTLKQDITVKGCQPYTELIPPFKLVQKLPVMVWYRSFGEIDVELSFGPTCVFEHQPGGFITGLLSLKATNRSSKRVNALKFTLREDVMTRGGECRATNSYGACKDVSVAIPPIDNNSRRRAGEEEEEEEAQQASMVEKHLVARFPMPPNASCVTDLVRLTHSIEVAFGVSSLWGCPEPLVRIPVFLY